MGEEAGGQAETSGVDETPRLSRRNPNGVSGDIFDAPTQIAGFTYNVKHQRFERPDGTEVTDADFRAIAASKRDATRAYASHLSGRDGEPALRTHLRDLHASPAAGRRTLKRAVLVKQLASSEGGELAQLLAGHGGRSAEHPTGQSLRGLKGIFYARREEANSAQATPSVPVDARATATVATSRLNLQINQWLRSLGAKSGFTAREVARNGLPDAMDHALDGIERVPGVKVHIIRNLTPDVGSRPGLGSVRRRLL